nr:MAG TPA: nin one binding protein [Caudoviricetes sp.]
MKKEIKPKVYSLCSCGYDLIYKCGKCEYTFNMAHNGFDYCPHCGSKIDWGVIITVNEEWKSEFLNNLETPKENQMKEEIDRFNLTITDGQRRILKQTQATRNAIIKSNIQYYLGIGWSKEELIKKGFFKEGDFDL